jgi:hypothetical protein
MIPVSFCCNDPNSGAFTGRVCAIHIHGNPDIELEHKFYPDLGSVLSQVGLPKGAADRCNRGVKIGRKIYGCYGWSQWCGNWCWDGTRMTGVDVLGLLRDLREQGWRCVASEAKFGDAWDSGQELTPKLVQEALARSGR